MRAWRRIVRTTGTGADGGLRGVGVGGIWRFGQVCVFREGLVLGGSWCRGKVGGGGVVVGGMFGVEGQLVSGRSWCWGKVGVGGVGVLVWTCARYIGVTGFRFWVHFVSMQYRGRGEGGACVRHTLRGSKGRVRKLGKGEKGNSWGWSLARCYIFNEKGGGWPKGPCLRVVLLRL